MIRLKKMLKAALKHKHTHFSFSFIQKIGHKFARIPFDTVPHKSHNAINIDFSIAFWYLYVLSGISVAFRYFGAFRYLYAPLSKHLIQLTCPGTFSLVGRVSAPGNRSSWV